MKFKSTSIAIVCIGLFFLSNLSTAQETEKAEPKVEVEDLTNLEDIPFTMPENWTYQKNPGTLPKGFKGMAGAPPTPDVTVTVWGYEVDSYIEFAPLFKRDMKQMGIPDVTITLNDTLINGLTVQNNRRFKWIGKYFKKDGSYRMIAIGAGENIYEDKWPIIRDIFNSIRED